MEGPRIRYRLPDVEKRRSCESRPPPEARIVELTLGADTRLTNDQRPALRRSSTARLRQYVDYLEGTCDFVSVKKQCYQGSPGHGVAVEVTGTRSHEVECTTLSELEPTGLGESP